MGITIREVHSGKDLRDFVKLPAKIHAGHSNWIPPIYMDEWGFFNPKKNRSFLSCDHIRLLAYRDNVPVGRIMGLVSHKYNQIKGENNARFSYLETYNDQEVAHLLLSAVERWAAALGKDKVVGPLGFSDKEPQGYLTEGFDEPIVLAANCNYPYQVDLVRNEGYMPEINLVSYLAEVPRTTPAIYQRILPRLEHLNSEFRVIEFTSLWKLRRYIRPVLSLTNRAFKQIYGALPYEEREMDDFANRFIIFLNPRFIKVIENLKKEVVAYVVAMPDISRGLQKCRGHLLPFGLLTVLRSGRKSDRMVNLLGAVDEPYRGRGLDVIMGLKMFDSARKTGKKYIDSHLVLESNTAMCSEYERIDGRIYKRYQIFSKNLR
jgi:hypothetical protein